MYIRLTSLDMVMKVIPKRLNMTDNLRLPLLGQMPREQHESNIPHVLSSPLFPSQTRLIRQLQRRFIAEQNLGCVLDGAAPRVHELLQEHLAEDAVGLLAEDGAEDYGDPVVRGFDVDGFLFAVVDGADGAALCDAFRRGLVDVFGGFGG